MVENYFFDLAGFLVFMGEIISPSKNRIAIKTTFIAMLSTIRK
jgi:hypothetical protein